MADNTKGKRFEMTYEQIVHAIKVLQRNVSTLFSNVTSLFSSVASINSRLSALEDPLSGGGDPGGGTIDFSELLIDEDDFATNTDQRAPTQQSAKSYIDEAFQSLDTRVSSGEVTLSGAVDDISEIDSRVSSLEGPPLETDDTGSAYTFDLSTKSHFDLTLTDNCTFTFPATGISGEVGEFLLYLKRDSTSDRTVTWDSDVKWAMDVVPVLDGTALTMSVFKFTQLGNTSRWYGECLGMGYVI